jgi:hypothetical protein
MRSPELAASPEGLRATVERLAAPRESDMEKWEREQEAAQHVDREQGVLELSPGLGDGRERGTDVTLAPGEAAAHYVVEPMVEVPLPWRAARTDVGALLAVPPDREASRYPIPMGGGVFRWLATREGGYQRTEYAHALPPAPEGWRWSSAQVSAVGGRGKLHVSAAVTNGTEGEGAETGAQALVLEITGRGGYCTGLDVLLFARPAEVRR